MPEATLVYQVGNVRSEQLPPFRSGVNMAVYFGPKDVAQAAYEAFYKPLPKFLLAVGHTYMGTPYEIRQGFHEAGESYGLAVECAIYNTSPGAVRRSQRFYAAMQQLADASAKPPAPAAPVAIAPPAPLSSTAGASALYLLDFDQVAEAGFRTKHRPTFPVAMLAHATDATLATCAFVRTHARHHHEAWWLPLYDRDVRHWVKALRFTKPPSVQVGGVDVVCGKEVPVD